MLRVFLLVTCLLGTAGHVLAQRAASIARIEVALWPEYDRADSVLVIYRFQLRPGTRLPTTVAVAVPVEVSAPHAVAWKNPQGGLMLAEFRRVVDGDRALILVTTQGLEGQLEFYTDLVRDGRTRSFRFEWPGGIEAGELAFEIQHPPGSSSFETTPPPAGRRIGQDGLTYEAIELGPLVAAAKPTIELSYEKDATGLTADMLRPPSRPPQDVESEPATAAPAERPWLLYISGGALIALGLVVFWWTSRKPPAAVAREKVDPRFCLNCGTKLQPRGEFCTECGTRVRG